MKKKLIITLFLSASLLCQSASVLASPAPDGKTDASTTVQAQNGSWDSWKTTWNSIKDDWTYVAMSPGSNESEMNFAWYSKSDENTYFKYGLKSDLSDGTNASVISDTCQDNYKSNKVTLKNLLPGTTYYYQVNGKDICSFTTDNDTKDFSFIFVGDPQIGSSNEEKAKKPADILKDTFLTAQSEAVRNDSYNWNNTLNAAYAKTNNKASFILSSGDQIQTNAKKVQNNTISEIEYTGYLSSNILRHVPVATTVGNHDADNANYTYHFNTPNASNLGSNGIVGGDYYYTYGDALFIMLNTQDTNVSEHKTFIENAVKSNPDCKWRVVTLHQDIYGSAEHSNEPEITNLRYELTPILEANDVDIVLTGHDHAYSRTKMLYGGTKTNNYTDDEFDTQLDKDLDNGDSTKSLTVAPQNIKGDTTDEDEKAYLNYLKSVMDENAIDKTTENKDVAINSKGILYLTAGSSSGSKYYDLVPRMQTYIANRWQEDVPTYTVCDVTETTLTINTYRTDTNTKIDSQFTLVKSVNHDELNNLISKGESINKNDYTSSSYSVLEQALNGAKNINANEASTTDEISNAYAALNDAINSLVKVSQNNDSNKYTVTSTSTLAAGENIKPTKTSSNKISKTSDNANAAFPIVLALGFLTALLATFKLKKRKLN